MPEDQELKVMLLEQISQMMICMFFLLIVTRDYVKCLFN